MFSSVDVPLQSASTVAESRENAGYLHFLKDIMALYAWGCNKFGELGLEDQNSVWSPQNVVLADNGQLPVSVAAGEGHSLFATDSGDVYCFGRGREGQLGLGNEKRNVEKPTLLRELQHESVIKVAAGAISSYAVTATGRVYHWGLVHKPQDIMGGGFEEQDQAAAGQLTGLAEDQDNFVVQVDVEARQDASYATSHTGYAYTQQEGRQLRDIVQTSTERWMLANDGADEEYHREMSNMGYDKEEVEERMQHRGREYHGMMKLQCKRVFLTVPEVISSLSHVRITSIAAGYAHCIVLSDTGRLFSVGYNDRGQLGLGHRISTSEFKPVDYLEGRFVVQVVAGQQHTMCRAIERSASGGIEAGSRSKAPASVYVWGNGMLGQLGLGLKGTSKGRLLPTLLSTLTDVCPLGAIDISAGGNFSMAVSLDGDVFSWGHAEYNQHGTGTVGGSDYVDNFHFFVPRKVNIVDDAGAEVKISQLSCGSAFTMAVTEDGDLYSWGWNAYGVLGQGKGHFPQVPYKVQTLGRHHVDRTVSEVSAGSNHVLVNTISSGNAWAKTFLGHLKGAEWADAEIVDETTGDVFPCHRVILAARSSYFRGFFRAADRMRKQAMGSGNERHQADAAVREEVILSCPAATSANIQYLLEYIYTDTLSAPTHRRRHLAELAEFVGITRLVVLCRQHVSYSERRDMMDAQDGQSADVPASSFEADMMAIVGSSEFADVKFCLSTDESLPPPQATSDVDEGAAEDFLYAHRVLLNHMSYFQTLLSGRYGDGELDSEGVLMLDTTGFGADGIQNETLRKLMMYAYSGTSSIIDVDDSYELMCLIVAANRVGLSQLGQLCEKKLSLHLGDFPENIENCLEFANTYNIPRLGRQCEEILEHQRRLTGREVV